MKTYYLDTSIWLDFFEKRDEPNLPKSTWARKLINKIIRKDGKIVYSDFSISELENLGYSFYEIKNMFLPLKNNLIFAESTKKQIGKSKDLSLKRNIPKGDALHALIARDNNAMLITLDKHFQKLSDIANPVRPQDII